MKIYRLLQTEDIHLDAPLASKDAVLEYVAGVFHRVGVAVDEAALLAGLRERESVMTTGIGKGIAIPHAAVPGISRAALLLVRPAAPVEYQAVDGEPVDIVLAMACPAHRTGLHLQLLAAAARLCRQEVFAAEVRGARSAESLWQRIRDLEEEMAFH